MSTDSESPGVLEVISEGFNVRNELAIPFFVGGLLVDALQAQVMAWSNLHTAEYKSHMEAFHRSLHYNYCEQTNTRRSGLPEAFVKEISAKHTGKLLLTMDVVVAEGDRTYYEKHFHARSRQYVSILGERQGFPEPQSAYFFNDGFNQRVISNMSFVVNPGVHHGFSFGAADSLVYYLEVSGPELYGKGNAADFRSVELKARPSF